MTVKRTIHFVRLTVVSINIDIYILLLLFGAFE